jgi:hypothetical protein
LPCRQDDQGGLILAERPSLRVSRGCSHAHLDRGPPGRSRHERARGSRSGRP